MKKNFKKIFILIVTVLLLGQFSNVNAQTYDPNLDSIKDLKVESDGTITWKKTLYAYGVWVKPSSESSYSTALTNKVLNEGTNTINLINLIESNCTSASYGCPDGVKTGEFNVLIKENNAAGVYVNSEFTVNYDGNRLTGAIVDYTVTFDTNGGSSIPSQKIRHGQKIKEPKDPEKDNFIFYDWENADGYDIDSEIYKDTTFKAIWKKIYNIISGAEQTFYKDTQNNITITADSQSEQLEEMYICESTSEDCYVWDGVEEDADVKITNNTVTLKSSFLNQLEDGMYYIGLVYKDGIAATTFYIANTGINLIPVYRMYNPVSGEHLYTTDAYEVSVIYRTQGWGKEGIAWYTTDFGTPVYRLYNPLLGNHLYTSDKYEISVITKTRGWVLDFNGEPVMYASGIVPVYRLFNPGLQGQHHLTTDKNEYNVIPKWGWEQEGTAMYAQKLGIPETTHYYR